MIAARLNYAPIWGKITKKKKLSSQGTGSIILTKLPLGVKVMGFLTTPTRGGTMDTNNNRPANPCIYDANKALSALRLLATFGFVLPVPVLGKGSEQSPDKLIAKSETIYAINMRMICSGEFDAKGGYAVRVTVREEIFGALEGKTELEIFYDLSNKTFYWSARIGKKHSRHISDLCASIGLNKIEAITNEKLETEKAETVLCAIARWSNNYRALE
jgi:hypothetical protein